VGDRMRQVIGRLVKGREECRGFRDQLGSELTRMFMAKVALRRASSVDITIQRSELGLNP
jgi:hypothetical protein